MKKIIRWIIWQYILWIKADGDYRRWWIRKTKELRDRKNEKGQI